MSFGLPTKTLPKQRISNFTAEFLRSEEATITNRRINRYTINYFILYFVKKKFPGSAQSDSMQIPLITQQSASTTRSGSVSPVSDNNNTTSANKLKVKLEIEKTLSKMGQTTNEAILNTRRGRFIVLGSSGECLPVKRQPPTENSSSYTSCESSEEEFHSAQNSLDDGKYKKIYISINYGLLYIK